MEDFLASLSLGGVQLLGRPFVLVSKNLKNQAKLTFQRQYTSCSELHAFSECDVMMWREITDEK